MAEFDLEEIFPLLNEVPDGVANELRTMVRLYREATRNKRKLVKLSREHSTIWKVNDSQGNLYCLFKSYTRELYAKHDAVFYLLDHPQDDHRSISSESFGLSRVPPTVYIRTSEASGCLVKYVKNEIGVQLNTVEEFNFEEIQRIGINHIRFGNPDAHPRNTLATKDENGIHRLTLIDNEECLTNGFKLTKLWWPDLKEAKEPFSKQMVKYVKELDVEKDINFLKACGFEFQQNHKDALKIFTFFLKKAVEMQLNIYEIGLLASGVCKKPSGVNLFEMVSTCDRKQTGDVFVKNVQEKIQEGLKEYVKKIPGGRGKSKK